MTLGDIFEKLGRISIHSILSLWGWVTWVVMIVVVLFAIVFVVISVSVWLFSVVSWYLILFFVFMLGGTVAHGTLNAKNYYSLD